MTSLYESIVRESNDGIFVAQNGEIVYVNRRLREISGYTEGELLGAAKTKLVVTTDEPLVEAHHRARTSGDPAPAQYEVEFETQAGERVPVELSVSEIEYEGETAAVTFCRDLTTQTSRKRDLERRQTFLEHSSDVLFVFDRDGVVTYQSDRTLSPDGPEIVDLEGKTPSEAVHPDDVERMTAAFETLLEHPDDTEVTELRIETTGGDWRWVENRAQNFLDDPEVAGILVSSRDITDRKSRERKLEETKQRLTVALDGTETGVWEWDLETDEVTWTRSMERLFGVEPGAFEGTYDAFAQYVHPDDLPPLERQIEQTVVTGKSLKTEYRIRSGDGGERWGEVRAELVEHEDRSRRLIGIVTDVTDRKERNARIELQSEAMEGAMDGIAILDGDEYVYVNQAHADMFGYEPGELVGNDWRELYDRAEIAWFENEVFPILPEAGEWRGEAIGRAKDGSSLAQELALSLLDSGELICTTRDITERKASKQALETAREELRQIIDLVPDLLFAKNRDGEYLLANEATAEAYGKTVEEIEGKTESTVIPDSDDAKAFRQDDLSVIESGEPAEISEEELTTVDGETRILQTRKIPYQASGSGDDAVLGYARDVTDLKEYERRLETQRDNLEVVNQVVRHDIRNELQVVLAYAATLDEYVEETGQAYVEQVQTAARNAVEITSTARDVTDVMLQSGADCLPIRLQAILETEIESARSNHDNAVVTIDGVIPDARVLADDMLDSVFRNLLSNAIRHNDEDVPEVAVSATVAGDAAVVEIADNGPGIDDDHKARIFEHGEMGLESEGTGIGLYLVDALVERYGGTVRIADNEPKGAIFVVRLPLAEANR
ncbi:PAS domain S-box protein [Natrarchaeobaculum aegyptiacum]|uniref:histidine kinase n=1 Tax=Natrarchaeobaculum aegyptiacum TaxID=745377 RepID=A0A2Z2I084_9EURY|nr:PAS domain S-box protein [Natrarchaeobaculum aegyptiacum]ARS90894.1 hypothetical protein B1756_14930 [Natrarchaeobaculum aegyptiacum]